MSTTLRPLRVLVVDDEALNRQRVEDLLRAEPGISEIRMASNGAEAIAEIRAGRPDLVFLDVQMPGKSGLDVVHELGDEMPATIFVTAHDQHALAAFDLDAVDYLMKPFDDERFGQALERARRRLELEDAGRVVSPPAPDVEPATPFLERIPVETRGKVQVVPVGDIEYIVASGPYAELHTAGRTHLIREAMQTLEERLDPARFIRVHRSVIVRLDLVDALLRGAGGDYEVQLRTGARLKVSRSRRAALERRMGITP